MKIAIMGDFFVQHPETISIDKTVIRLLAKADYRILNLEGSLYQENIPPPHTAQPLKSGPCLRMPYTAVNLIKQLGADTLTLANNHLMDYGEEGYQETKQYLSGEYSLVGCGDKAEAYRLQEYEEDGLKVGVLNLCEMQFGMLYDPWTQDEEAVGCAWVNHPETDELIIESKKRVDRLIAICHCGVEHVAVPLPEWRDRYRQMIRLGCDAIVSHHPHIVQGYEIYMGCPICYSLGNFLFVRDGSPNDGEWNIGGLAMLDIGKESIDVNTYGVKTVEGRQLCLMEDGNWQKYIQGRNQLLEDACYMQAVNDACMRLYGHYENLFAAGGFFPAASGRVKSMARAILHRYNLVHALNNLQCESHRWCICRAIRLKEKSIR